MEPFYFRELFETILEYEGADTYTELLAPWVAANPAAREWLQSFAARTGNPVPEAEYEELWCLYSLSKVCDVLLNGLPDDTVAEPAWRCPPLSVAEFQQFFESLGMSASWPQSYSPFHHEITALVTGDDPDAPPAVLACEWPCLMLGPMLFQRAGARVAAGSKVLAPGIADAATIYWTYYRRNRPALDMSNGWGSNSRWRTAFRRDYQFDDLLCFNVDGSEDLSSPKSALHAHDSLNRTEGIEVLVNRHFVTSPLPHDDLCPFSYKLCTESLAALDAPDAPEQSVFSRILNKFAFR